MTLPNQVSLNAQNPDLAGGLGVQLGERMQLLRDVLPTAAQSPDAEKLAAMLPICHELASISSSLTETMHAYQHGRLASFDLDAAFGGVDWQRLRSDLGFCRAVLRRWRRLIFLRRQAAGKPSDAPVYQPPDVQMEIR